MDSFRAGRVWAGFCSRLEEGVAYKSDDLLVISIGSVSLNPLDDAKKAANEVKYGPAVARIPFTDGVYCQISII